MIELLVFLAGVTTGVSLAVMTYMFYMVPKAMKSFKETVEVAEQHRAGHTYRDTDGHFVHRSPDGVERRIEGRPHA